MMAALSNGRHLAFPFRIGADGRTAAPANDDAHVRDELLQLLLTSPAERLFLPDFGGGVRRLVFESADDATAGLAKAVITQSVTRYLGHRVTLEELTVVAVNETIEIDLKYRIAGTEDTRVLRFQRRGG